MITCFINAAKSYLGYSTQKAEGPEPNLGALKKIETVAQGPIKQEAFFPYKKMGAIVLLGLLGGKGQRLGDTNLFSLSWGTAEKAGFVFGSTQLFGPLGGVAAWAATSEVLGYTPPEVVGNCPEVYRETWGENPIGCALPAREITMTEEETYFMGGFHHLVSAPDGNILRYSLEGLPPEANITQDTLLFENLLLGGTNVTCLPQPDASTLIGFSGPTFYVWQRTSGDQLTLLNSTDFGQTRPFLGGEVFGQLVILRTNATVEMISIAQPRTPSRYPPINRAVAASQVDPNRSLLWATSIGGDLLLSYSVGDPRVPIQYAESTISGGGAYSLTLVNSDLLLIPGPNTLRRFDISALALPAERSSIPLNATATGVVITQEGLTAIFTPAGYSVWNATGTSPTLISTGNTSSPGVDIHSLTRSGAYLIGKYTGTDTGIVVLQQNANQTFSASFAPSETINSFVLSSGNTVIQCGVNITLHTLYGVTVQITPSNVTQTVPFSFHAADENGVDVSIPMRLAIVAPLITTQFHRQIPPGGDGGQWLLSLLALPPLCLMALLSCCSPLLLAICAQRKQKTFQKKGEVIQIDYKIESTFGGGKYGVLRRGGENKVLIAERYGIVFGDDSAEIGSGGFSSVELILSMGTGELAVAKKITENPEGQFNKYEASIEEARLHRHVAQTAGEGVWPILNTAEEGEQGSRTMYHMFPFAELGNLEQFLKKFIFNYEHPNLLSEIRKAQIQRVLAQKVLLGFSSAHQANVTHSDPKADNVLVGTENAGLSDFGRARQGTTANPLSALQNDLGAVIYFNPGRLHAYSQGSNGRFDGRKADAFGAGSILLQIMTGESFYDRLCLTGERCDARGLIERAKNLPEIMRWFRSVVDGTPALQNPESGSLGAVTRGLLLETLTLEEALKMRCFQQLPPYEEALKGLLELQIQLCQQSTSPQAQYLLAPPIGNVPKDENTLFGLYNNIDSSKENTGLYQTVPKPKDFYA